MTVVTAPRPSRLLLPAFWAGVGLLLVYVTFTVREVPAQVLLTAGLVSVAALLPTYFWCAGQVGGLPLYPVLALTYLYTFAFPLLSQQAEVAHYGFDAQVQAGLTAVGFLAVATLCWYLVLRRPGRPPASYLALRPGASDHYFLAFLGAGCLYQAATLGQWLPVAGGVHSLLNAVTSSLATLAVAVEAYRLGKGHLDRGKAVAFVILFVVYLLLQAATLLLVGALTVAFLAAVTYTIGRGRPPLVLIVVALLLFSVLHLGKADMRNKYWGEDRTIQPWDYLGRFAEWLGDGFDMAARSLRGYEDAPKDRVGLLERSSLLQMLMLVQDKTPDPLPHLYGETYAVIPQLLLPRAINPNKPWSHEGTYILSTYYGLQNREQTLKTTIGFGLLTEAYANFGYPGVLGLAVLTGLGLGYVTRLALGLPLFALRGLFALSILTQCIHSEATAALITSSLFQSTVALLALALFLMEPVHARQADRRPVPLGEAA